MFYIGLGMVLVGWILLHYFGISVQEQQEGKAYARSDTLGSFLMVIGMFIVGGYLLYWLGQMLFVGVQHVFYGVELAYAESPAQRAALLAFGSATLFMSSLMLCVRAESLFRFWRRTDHAQARRLKANYYYFAQVFHLAGRLALLVSVLYFAHKSL